MIVEIKSEDTIKDCYKIFKEVFNTKMTFEQYYYKHFYNNNKIQGSSNLLYTIDEVACGTNSFMGCKLIYGKNEIIAAQSCDTAVLKEYQGKRIFYNIIEEAKIMAKNNNIDIIFGFPNENSYPGFIKLKFKTIGKFNTYFNIINPIRFFYKRYINKSIAYKPIIISQDKFKDSDGVIYEIHKNCPFDNDDIEKINCNKNIHTYKGKDYFKWRIDNNLSLRFGYITIKDKDDLLGYLIFSVDNNRANIIDWNLLNNSFDKQIKIIKFTTKIIKKYSDIVFFNYVNTNEEQILKKSGFIIKKNSESIMVSYAISKKGKDKFLSNIQNWQLRGIDIDTILNFSE